MLQPREKVLKNPVCNRFKISGTFKLAAVQKECQLNRAEPRELKDNSDKLSRNQR